jgi:hypothetical protein
MSNSAGESGVAVEDTLGTAVSVAAGAVRVGRQAATVSMNNAIDIRAYMTRVTLL